MLCAENKENVMKLITFTVPCYNSAAYMSHCVETLLPAGEEAEIIQESSIGARIPKGSHIKLAVNNVKINVFTEDGKENILYGVNNAVIEEDKR